MEQKYCMKIYEPWRKKVLEDGIVVMTCSQPVNLLYRHHYFELGYMAKGTARHYLNGDETVMHEGDYFIMDLSAAHAYFGDDACEMVNLLFYPWIIDPTLSGCEHLSQLVSHFLIQYLPKNLSSFSDRIFHDTHCRIRQLIEEIAKELYFRQPGFQAVVRAQMIRLIVEIMRRMGEKQQRSYSRITQDVIAVIERRYASALTLREVAARLGYSPAYLSRRFHADVGQSFIDYLQRFRLEMACHLLTTGKKSVAEIAAMVGYQDVRFFYQLFKRTYQCTPSIYRRNNKIDQKPQG
ncbi:MAG: hypothetical protein DBX52_04925 [Clostridiales bacterium]|nr:MAG: hypothetical protein DBX52_04925 [Clostridiales bacterium]